MGIIGKWSVTEAKVFDKDFKYTWRKVADVLTDGSITPFQKVFARTVYVFEEDGRALTLLPKELIPAAEAEEAYDTALAVAHTSQWKEEGGKFFIATEENGNTEWNEIVTDGEEYIILDMHRIAKA